MVEASMAAAGRPDRQPPVVSVLIVVRNESQDIADCIEAIGGQDIGAQSIEVVIADDESVDDTIKAATEAAARWQFSSVRVVPNDVGGRSAGLNAALAAATAPIVARVDARARIPQDYLRKCRELLTAKPEVGVVGGRQIALARSTSTADAAIARALNNRLAMGFSRYRRAAASGPTDTVWLGTFRRDELVRLHGWPREIDINEDFELNRRFRASGAVVWLDSSLRSGYLPRRTVRALFRQYHSYGRAKADWWRRGQQLERRQVALLAFPPLMSFVALVTVLRFGRKVGVAVLGGALVIDGVGGAGPAPLRVRLRAASVNAVIGAAWWSGVVAGLVDRAEERHDS